MTIQRTFYRSILQSLAKLGGILLGAVFGLVFGIILGPSPLAFGLTIIVIIWSCLQLNWQDHVLTAAVVAVGIISSDAQNLPAFSLQQVLSALVAGVVAITINYLFTPNHRQELKEKLLMIEGFFQELMDAVAQEMLHPGCRYEEFDTEAELLEAEIRSALQLTKLVREEQHFNLSRETLADQYREAFRILASQLDRLQEMHKLAKRMPVAVPQARNLAKLLRILKKIQKNQLTGKRVHYSLLDKTITGLEESFARMDLPVSRDEFISRSSLVHLFRELKKYYKRIREMPPVLREQRFGSHG
jgi:uncharacterized membrane protein YgaE (UPF0421/DUF939 family)